MGENRSESFSQHELGNWGGFRMPVTLWVGNLGALLSAKFCTYCRLQFQSTDHSVVRYSRDSFKLDFTSTYHNRMLIES